MKRFIPFFSIAVVALIVGLAAGWILANNVSATKLERVVAMSWHDGIYGQSFYGTHVYLEPISNGYSVRARVYIGRGNDYFHDCGELGKVETAAEAVAKWGAIDWRADGLHIGSGNNQYFLPIEKLQNHR